MNRKDQFCYDYPRPAVTTDCVVFLMANDGVKVLLIQRDKPPFEGQWAFPGGFLNMDEDAETGAMRELKEETGLTNVTLHQLRTFSAVDRDPRGRTISIVFAGVVRNDNSTVKGMDDARYAAWFDVNDLPPLAFDHDIIMNYAIEWFGNYVEND